MVARYDQRVGCTALIYTNCYVQGNAASIASPLPDERLCYRAPNILTPEYTNLLLNPIKC